jgi:hypothetical protein
LQIYSPENWNDTCSSRRSRVMTTSFSHTRFWAPSSIPRSCESASREQRNVPDCDPFAFHDVRHTFGTRMAAAGRQCERFRNGRHRDSRTTGLYADYAPDASQGAAWAARAFGEIKDDGVSTESQSLLPT